MAHSTDQDPPSRVTRTVSELKAGDTVWWCDRRINVDRIGVYLWTTIDGRDVRLHYEADETVDVDPRS